VKQATVENLAPWVATLLLLAVWQLAVMAFHIENFVLPTPIESIQQIYINRYPLTLHGLATLTRTGRLPPKDTESRVELLVDRTEGFSPADIEFAARSASQRAVSAGVTFQASNCSSPRAARVSAKLECGPRCAARSHDVVSAAK